MTPDEIEEIRERAQALSERNCVVSPEMVLAVFTALEEAEARVERYETALREILNRGGLKAISTARRALEREE